MCVCVRVNVCVCVCVCVPVCIIMMYVCMLCVYGHDECVSTRASVCICVCRNGTLRVYAEILSQSVFLSARIHSLHYNMC